MKDITDARYGKVDGGYLVYLDHRMIGMVEKTRNGLFQGISPVDGRKLGLERTRKAAALRLLIDRAYHKEAVQ